MMCGVAGRVDYFDDPGAPRANSLVPSVNVVVTGALGGEPTPSDESREVRWVAPDAVGALQMDRSMRLRIGHYLAGGPKPHLG